MTEQIERQGERRKNDMGCWCGRNGFTECEDGFSERKADRRSTPKVAQLAIPEEVLKGIQASNCVSQSDPNCTPLPMGVQPATWELIDELGVQLAAIEHRAELTDQISIENMCREMFRNFDRLRQLLATPGKPPNFMDEPEDGKLVTR